MKQLLYFLIGVLISACLMIPYAKADCVDVASGLSSSDQIVGHSETSSEASALAESARQSGAGSDAIGTCSSGEPGWWDTAYQSITVNGVTLFCMRNKYGCWDVSGVPVLWGPWYCASYGTQTACIIGDSDGDGIQDKYDLKPDSASSYKAAIISVCYDQNHKVVAGVIQDGEGNQYSFGTMPTDMEGYTIESVTGDLITYQTAEDLATTLGKLNIDDLNITKQNKPIEIKDDGTIIPGSTDPFRDYKKAEEDQTTSKKPPIQEAPTTPSTDGDSDSTHFKKIVDNTNSTNKNLENIAGYLGITNDLLAKINNKTGSQSAVGSSGGVVVVGGDSPSADEIGQSVKDNLIDSGQTIDTTTTDNIPDLDETDTLAEITTKYLDRFNLFVDTFKSTDLYTLPFSIFNGPSGSGSSIQTVEIGAWGSSDTRTATIDYSQYDNVWNILRTVLLMLTSFACFKILFFKKA